jgi:Kef-type K+ transport system membrane component KefB
MSTLDELKKDWNEGGETTQPESFNRESLKKIFKSRVSKHLREPFEYFWASFGMQILLYALLSNVIVKNWGDETILFYSAVCILMYIPFTVMLLKKFKQMARSRIDGADAGSMHAYVERKSEQLRAFFTFKKRYEFVLIPISCAIGIVLPFEIYAPGGAATYPNAMLAIFVVTLTTCAITIYLENEKSFKKPLKEFEILLAEFKISE